LDEIVRVLWSGVLSRWELERRDRGQVEELEGVSGDIRVEIFRVHEFEHLGFGVPEFGHFHGVWGAAPVIWEGEGRVWS
jgi:hypothetical protein